MGKGEGDACGAGGDDIDAVTTVVGEGGAKIEGSVPVRVPRETVVGAPRAHNVEGKFGVRKEAVPQVSGKVGMGGSEGGDKVVLAGPH